jgi:hypothetical protein
MPNFLPVATTLSVPTSLSVFFCQCLLVSVYLSSVPTSTVFQCLPSCQCLTVPSLLLVLSSSYQCLHSGQCLLYCQCVNAYPHVNIWVQVPGSFFQSLLASVYFFVISILLSAPAFVSLPYSPSCTYLPTSCQWLPVPSVANPDPESDAFLPPGSWIRIYLTYGMLKKYLLGSSLSYFTLKLYGSAVLLVDLSPSSAFSNQVVWSIPPLPWRIL